MTGVTYHHSGTHDFDSIDTEDARINNSATILEGNSSVVYDTEPKTSVDTSNTVIYTSADPFGGYLLISGIRDDGINSTSFMDIVMVMPQGRVDVVNKLSRPDAATRTYSNSTKKLELAMGSDTYDVFVHKIEPAL